MLLSSGERRFLEAVSTICYANPFSEELIQAEKQALGERFVAERPVWSLDSRDPLRPRANSWLIAEKAGKLVHQLRQRLIAKPDAAGAELQLYEDAALLTLYYRFYNAISDAAFDSGKNRWDFYRDFAEAFDQLLHLPAALPGQHQCARTFALFVQIVRAFRRIFEYVLGSSHAAGRLRASIWRSIFTHDMRRYHRALATRMGEFATLIAGPSGTGKELVARAIATSRFQPFDEQRLAFPFEADALFLPINIAALTPALVESELFGHRRGAFTGAVADRKGYLESCPALGGVFLDELGEMSMDVQVKLLRVIETRQFTPVGDTHPRRFEGKLIAATNRDLGKAIQQGRFREDLYYRLCSDIVKMPSLAEQLDESPAVLEELVSHMALKSGADQQFAIGAVEWIRNNLGGHRWPGNYRELEQCVRNLVIRGEYRPPEKPRAAVQLPDWIDSMLAGTLSAEDVVGHYCRLVYEKVGTYEGTAQRIGLDRRTVKAKLTA
jgi:transcriptional regulator of acetoin/glycerol metabolism